MKKRLTVIICCTMLVAALASGCGLGLYTGGQGDVTDKARPTTESTRSEIVLTERQISILQKQGLPINYEQLTVKQKSAIGAIEAMLVYLESKYQTQFEYEGYVAASSVEREHLLATTTIQNEVKVVTVYRTYENGAWAYEDNYMHFLAEPVYRKALISFFDSKIDPNGYKIFSTVEWIDGEYSEENVLKNVAAGTVLYVSKATCATEEDTVKLLQDFAGWMKSQGLKSACTVEICIVEASDLGKVFTYNYAESIAKDWVISHKICTIDNFGGVTIV